MINMVGTSVKNNIKSIIRDPTTILAFLAAVILRFINGVHSYVGPNGEYIDSQIYLSSDGFQYMLNTMVGMVTVSIEEILFPFIGIIIAINIFKDKRSNMYDLVESSQISFRKYYFSKILSYYILSVALCLLVTLFFGCVYMAVNLPAGTNIAWEKVFFVQLIAIVVSYTGCLLIPIALAVFLIAITGNPIVGAIANAVYNFVPYMFVGFSRTDFGHYVYVYPMSLHLYLKDWLLYPANERFSFEHQQLYGDGAPFHTSFPEALFSHGLQILIATVLLTASYFLLKRRFQRS